MDLLLSLLSFVLGSVVGVTLGCFYLHGAWQRDLAYEKRTGISMGGGSGNVPHIFPNFPWIIPGEPKRYARGEAVRS